MSTASRVLLIGCVSAVLLGGCARGAEPATDQSPTAARQSPTAARSGASSPSGPASPSNSLNPPDPSTQPPLAPGEPAPGASRPHTLVDTVKLVQTGGIAGVSNTWIVNPDGTWTATDRTEKARNGTLTPERLSDLAALVNNPELVRELGRSTGPKCADGFIYLLTLGQMEYRAASCGSESRPTFGGLVSLIQESTRA